jgi:hypothetical protein
MGGKFNRRGNQENACSIPVQGQIRKDHLKNNIKICIKVTVRQVATLSHLAHLKFL